MFARGRLYLWKMCILTLVGERFGEREYLKQKRKGKRGREKAEKKQKKIRSFFSFLIFLPFPACGVLVTRNHTNFG